MSASVPSRAGVNAASRPSATEPRRAKVTSASGNGTTLEAVGSSADIELLSVKFLEVSLSFGVKANKHDSAILTNCSRRCSGFIGKRKRNYFGIANIGQTRRRFPDASPCARLFLYRGRNCAMLRAEENDRLTRVGPGSEMGE